MSPRLRAFARAACRRSATNSSCPPAPASATRGRALERRYPALGTLGVSTRLARNGRLGRAGRRVERRRRARAAAAGRRRVERCFAIVRASRSTLRRVRAAVARDVFGASSPFSASCANRSDDGRAVDGLAYEAYEAMAVAEFEAIAGEAHARFGERFAWRSSIASGGRDVGEVAVAVVVGAPHRGAAFDACDYAIDELKGARADLEERALRRRQRRLEGQRRAHDRLSVELVTIAARRNPVAVLALRAAPPARRLARRRTRLLVEQTQSRFSVRVSRQPRVRHLQPRFSGTQAWRERRHAARHRRLHRRDGGDGARSRARAATRRAYAMGHSMGAMTALLYRGARPDDSRRVAIATGYGRPTALTSTDEPAGTTDFRAVVRRRRHASGVGRSASTRVRRTLCRGLPGGRRSTSPRIATRW